MPKLPSVNANEIIKALEKIGYQVVRQRGSHISSKTKVILPLLYLLIQEKLLTKGY